MLASMQTPLKVQPNLIERTRRECGTCVIIKSPFINRLLVGSHFIYCCPSLAHEINGSKLCIKYFGLFQLKPISKLNTKRVLLKIFLMMSLTRHLTINPWKLIRLFCQTANLHLICPLDLQLAWPCVTECQECACFSGHIKTGWQK